MPIEAHAPDDDPNIVAMLDTLAAEPHTLEDLRVALAKRQVFTDVESLRMALQWRPEAEEFLDGVWAWLPTLVNGVVLTHDVEADELEMGVLDGTDLELWVQLADEGLPFAGGGEVRARWSAPQGILPEGSYSGLAGPTGWLSGCKAGDRIALRYRDGALHLEVDPTLTDDDQVDETLAALAKVAHEMARQALDAYYAEEDAVPGVDVATVVAGVRRHAPHSFEQPLPPLGLVLETLGLETNRGYVGVPDAPWDGEADDLDADERSALQALTMAMTMHRLTGDVPGEPELSAIVQGLALGPALREAAGKLADDPDREPVAIAMVDATDGESRAGPLYLRASAAEGRGDAEAMESWLAEALAACADFAPALLDLAELKSIRGAAEEAWSLYQRAEVGLDLPEVQVLRRSLRKPAGQVSRNQPCPCGSGRKYKLCHGGQLMHPLAERAAWLWEKVSTYADRDCHAEVRVSFAYLLSDDGSVRQTQRNIDHPLTPDLMVFAGGLLKDFIAERGALLPADELALAESWLESRLRLLEVQEVRPGIGVVRFRDLVSGEQVAVADRTMSTSLEPKELVFGRPLPDGSGAWRVLSCPLSIPRIMRLRLLELLRGEPSGEEIARWFAATARPPQLRTTEGEEIVMCEARYDVADLDATWDKLSLELDLIDDELVEHVDVPGSGEVRRGAVKRDNGRLVVSTMSLERLRRLQQRLLTADPDARLVDESSIPIERVLAERSELEASGEYAAPERPGPQLTPEQEAEALAMVVEQQEQAWPDLVLPALGGRTPREAAADPELRPELEALLDDFEWSERHHPGPASMDVGALRRTLGLT